MIDIEATRDRIHELEMDSDGYLKTINLFWDVLKDVDAQAEEIKRLEIEVANWKYWRRTATKANDKCEAENKRLLDSLELIKETTAGDITAYVNLVHTIVNNALKPNTEEGET